MELSQRCADQTKAAATVWTCVAYSTQELVRWLSANRSVQILVNQFFIDASVPLAVSTSGESKNMGYLKKTQTLDLLFSQEMIRHLELNPTKIDSASNVADLWTKAVTRATLEKLLSIAGRKTGHNFRPMKAQ